MSIYDRYPNFMVLTAVYSYFKILLLLLFRIKSNKKKKKSLNKYKCINFVSVLSSIFEPVVFMGIVSLLVERWSFPLLALFELVY